MSFKISARTILQLGAELISSDSVAFYELIKNAFDAGSPKVDIDIVTRIDFQVYLKHLESIQNLKHAKSSIRNHDLTKLKNNITRDLIYSTPDANKLKGAILKAKNITILEKELKSANYIEIDDIGCGMGIDDLNDVFLTIGTKSKANKKKELSKDLLKDPKKKYRPILGEKGIGRLSAMRLGSGLQVITSRDEDDEWHELEIDWDKFSHESDQLVGDIKLQARQYRDKNEDDDKSGTLIHIYDLCSAWTHNKIQSIAVSELSRFNDPFIRNKKFIINLTFNGERVIIPEFNDDLFEAAHAVVKANYYYNEKGPSLDGEIEYRQHSKGKVFSLGKFELESLITTPQSSVQYKYYYDISPDALRSLGSFNMKFYWYNRRILTAIEGVGTRRDVQKLVNRWAHGLMLFRDGFRVSGCGGPEDDWLDLDKKALGHGGYKVNRHQLIGKIDISSFNNPKLKDQTNREGLVDCDEKAAFISILKYIIHVEFKLFIDDIDSIMVGKPTLTLDHLIRGANESSTLLKKSLQYIKKNYDIDKRVLKNFENSAENIIFLIDEAKRHAEIYENDRSKYLNLASLGLMLEVVAHELNRATEHSLSTLANKRNLDSEGVNDNLLSILEAQLKTLHKRLRILDPMSTSGRQVKERFDIVELIQDVMETHAPQFDRHGIEWDNNFNIRGRALRLYTKSVKGMIVQLIENILVNSIYWLKRAKIDDDNFEPEIIIEIDTKEKTISFTDNGPGVDPSLKEDIFKAFYSTKPPNLGKGMGLYISRELADYNNAFLDISDERFIHEDRLNTFVLRLEAEK